MSTNHTTRIYVSRQETTTSTAGRCRGTAQTSGKTKTGEPVCRLQKDAAPSIFNVLELDRPIGTAASCKASRRPQAVQRHSVPRWISNRIRWVSPQQAALLSTGWGRHVGPRKASFTTVAQYQFPCQSSPGGHRSRQVVHVL